MVAENRLFHDPQNHTRFYGDFCASGAHVLWRAAVLAVEMMYDPAYILMDETLANLDIAEGGGPSESTEGTSSGLEPPSTLEAARCEWKAQSQHQPEDSSQRAGPSDVANSQDQPSTSRSRKVPPSPEVVTGQTAEELLRPPTVDTVNEWITRAFTSSPDPSMARVSRYPAHALLA
jgi:hypothetical protein